MRRRLAVAHTTHNHTPAARISHGTPPHPRGTPAEGLCRQSRALVLARIAGPMPAMLPEASGSGSGPGMPERVRPKTRTGKAPAVLPEPPGRRAVLVRVAFQPEGSLSLTMPTVTGVVARSLVAPGALVCERVQEQRHLRTRHLRAGIEPLSRPAPGDPVIRDAVDRSLSTQTPGVHEPGVTRCVAHTRREHRQHVGLRRAAAHRRGPSRSRHHNRTNQPNHQQRTPQQTRLTPATAATGPEHQPPPGGETHYQREPTATSATTSCHHPAEPRRPDLTAQP